MLKQSVKMAVSSIITNKTRSLLTMLGIVIGIVAVVVLISMVSSATNSIMGDLYSLGADKLNVTILSQQGPPLTVQEVSGYASKYSSVAYASPMARQSASAKTLTKTADASVWGVTPSYQQIEDLSVQSGRFLKSPDVDNNSAVAVIGSGLADSLFATTDAVGKTFFIGGRSFRVIGVLDDIPQTLLGPSNDMAVIPYTLAERIFSLNGVTAFIVKASSADVVTAAQEEINQELLNHYRNKNAFSILNQSALLSSLDSITSTLSYMLGGIAAISLLVGGIGIMNIMLVSVTERTREIGIRKAIGATRRQILSQFLVESLVISTLGGLFGLLLSWGILSLLSYMMNSSYAMSPGAAVLAVVFSMGIGLVFGINPANKAAKMPPIVALRTE
ncbi:MAG: ABC transporter permease [Clostridiales bacterium]|nr:ABC transporter permease [Clostridiales bacterium]